MLVGLMMWRRLLTLGPDRYGDVYYLGQAPLVGHEGLADVLVTTHDVIETRFYFDPATSQLLALEMYPDAQVDPCEIRFLNYHDQNGHSLPGQMDVRYGDRSFGTVELENIELPAAAEKT
jgi:hypothetical protein